MSRARMNEEEFNEYKENIEAELEGTVSWTEPVDVPYHNNVFTETVIEEDGDAIIDIYYIKKEKNGEYQYTIIEGMD